eukprot:Plantae.Rhodophyta-Palmaria_palmata.ctg9455.p1 GENE.Plantae.Rhodophyta-Palmaria_palmata.ctg9455~~Plantae.Rhodophyta-Palmaria_palmata.ctg9455.p1  ORF type:complete len:252 (+),score=19.08 Plantae.Rhodophyta-Palmaria_palmata.ctg9455:30-785(+)
MSTLVNQLEARGSSYNHAIILAGHAVFKRGPFCPPESVASDVNWTLLSFQRDEPKVYLDQIRFAIHAAESDKRALLIFSGGRTRRDAGPISEARGYYNAALSLGLLERDISARVILEEYARDSYDNCLFGIARFAQSTGRLPTVVTMVSWEFKERRFLAHMTALNFPRHRFFFLGVGTPGDLDSALAGEAKTLEQFSSDVSGYGAILGSKKQTRNPFGESHSYEQDVPCMSKVLSYRGKKPLNASICPWAA